MNECHYHCRGCDRHFVSLRSFDKHRTGPHSDRRCAKPTGNTRTGSCKVSNPDAVAEGVTIHG